MNENDSSDSIPNETADGAADILEEVDATLVEPEETAAPSRDEEIEKWKDVAARATADLDNYRKRMTREKLEAIQYANRDLLEQLLPILDHFEMGLKAAEATEGANSAILQGMGMVRKQLEDFLTDQGVEVIVSDGVAFDPNVHEAMKQESSDTVAEGMVLYTLRRGYRLKERVLRAANVVVSSGNSDADAS